jgi:hypothetical protein
VVGVIVVVNFVFVACDSSEPAVMATALTTSVVPITRDVPADVTVTDRGCATGVSDPMRPGPAVFTVRNDSSSAVDFELLRVNVAYDTIVAFFADEVERLAAQQPSPNEQIAGYMDEIDREELQPGEDGSVGGVLAPGMYTVLCVVLDDNGDYLKPWPSGPVEVSGYHALWHTQARSYRGVEGQQFDFFCRPSGKVYPVWGTGTYTNDSSICTAAVHAGLITLDEGGAVTIEIRPGEESYEATERNGIPSLSYGSWGGSFVFIDD